VRVSFEQVFKYKGSPKFWLLFNIIFNVFTNLRFDLDKKWIRTIMYVVQSTYFDHSHVVRNGLRGQFFKQVFAPMEKVCAYGKSLRLRVNWYLATVDA
jgi:hypothetical protein